MMEKIKRPRTTPSTTVKVRLQCGNLYVTVSRHKDKMFEVFAHLGKTGGCSASQMSALTTAVTMGIRHGVEPKVYVDKLKGVHCPVLSIDDSVTYTSCPDAIGQVMEKEETKIIGGFYKEADQKEEGLQ